MLEILSHANSGFYFLGALLLFGAILIVILEVGRNHKKGTNKRGGRVFAVLIALFVLWSILDDGATTLESIKKSSNSFEVGRQLQCSSGFDTYLVSKERSWEKEGEMFRKEDLLIPLKNCQPYLQVNKSN